MVINISKRLSMFTLITVFLLLYLIPFNTHAINISGTVYTDEGLTPMADGRTVRLMSNGAGNYTDLLDSGNGIYTIAAIPAQSETVLTVFIDGAEEKGTTVMISDGADINNLHIYQNHIIVRNYVDGYIDLNQMSRYDKDQDIDILFDADTAGAYTLIVDPGNEFYIWPDSYFFAAFLTGSSIIVEDIKILGTYSAVWTWPTTYVSGNWTNLGLFQNGWGMGSVIFDAGSGTKYITSSGASIFSDITFNDGGGGATWILEDNLVVKDPVLSI